MSETIKPALVYGFTHADVRALLAVGSREAAVSATGAHELLNLVRFDLGTKEQLLSLAARIAALLPPES